MLKNILFFLLLVFGIQISISNIQFGIIYNFCLVFIFNKYLFVNYFENFTNCLYNSPSYQISLVPLVIDLGLYSKCNENNPKLQKVIIDTSTNEIQFNLEIEDLKKKFKEGDIINISGTILSSNSPYTIKAITTTKILINEVLPQDQTITSGKVVIKYASNLNLSDKFIVYKYDNLNDNITSVDNAIVLNKTNLTTMKMYQDLIKKANNDIETNNKLIESYRLQINSNINQNNIYKNTIQDKYILTDKYAKLVSSNVDLSNNKLKKVEKEVYNDLNNQFSKIDSNLSINEENKLKMADLTKKNQALNSLKCSYISKIKNLIKENKANDTIINSNNSSIDIQNKNYKLFMNKCNKEYDTENSLTDPVSDECKYS